MSLFMNSNTIFFSLRLMFNYVFTFFSSLKMVVLNGTKHSQTVVVITIYRGIHGLIHGSIQFELILIVYSLALEQKSTKKTIVNHQSIVVLQKFRSCNFGKLDLHNKNLGCKKCSNFTPIGGHIDLDNSRQQQKLHPAQFTY